MNWVEIVNNSELIYASTHEDKGFRTWSLKKTTCNVLFYESFPIEDIDQIVCSILESNDGSIIEEKIATILGFNVVDDFDITPKRYADKAELEIFRAIVKPVFDWGLVDRISEKENPIIFKITEFGSRALSIGKKHRFYSGKKILFDNPNIKPSELHENLFFPFYSALGEYSEIISKQQIQYNKINPVEVFDIEDTDLIKRHKLQSKDIYQIYKSEITNYFSFESCQVDIRLFKLDDKYYPILFYNNRISIEATDLLNKPENKNLIAKKIEWGLFLKLIKDPYAVLDYESIIPFEDLLELDSLIEDTRLVWDDIQLFTFIAERVNANQWHTISNQCPLDIIKTHIEAYSEKWDWTSLSLRVDDNFLIKNAIKFPWNFEAISAKEDIGIEILKTLLLIPELKEQQWDWDRIMPLLDFEFIKSNIDKIDFQLSELTKTNIAEVEPLIIQYPAKQWNWTYISNEYELSFILDNILNFRSFISAKNIINRAFVSENDINYFCKSDDFKRVLLQAKDSTLIDYSPNQSKYIWTEQLIVLLETTGFLTWESGRFTSGFECNPYIDWTPEFFKQYHSRIATQKGFDYVSTHISDTRIVNEYPNFHWNWDIISANSNLITDSNFLLSVIDKLNLSILLSEISSTTLEVIFDDANILSFLESNHERWIEVTEKSSKEFVLRHIDYSWDWSILTRRFCSTIKVDALGIPKWIEKWDWKYLTQNLDLEVVAGKLNLYVDRWDWEYLTENLNRDFVITNLTKYSNYWDWKLLIDGRLDKSDLLLSSHLPEIATCISFFYEEFKKALWLIITSKFDYVELEDLISATHENQIFHWDFVYFYSLPSFDIRSYLQNFSKYVSWKELSECKKLEETFRYDDKLFIERVWRNDIILQLDKYKWDFNSLSRIDSICSDFTILKSYRDRWDWDYLTLNCSYFKGLNSNKRKLKSFHQYINFTLISQREDAGITENIIAEYINEKWDWFVLSSNSSIHFSKEFILENSGKSWDWEAISIRQDITLDNKTLIELSDKNWDWEAISIRTDIIFSEELVNRLNDKPLNWERVSQNKSFVPNAITLSALKGKALDWDAISLNENISTDCLWDYREKLSWQNITKSRKFEISDSELLSKFQDFIDWRYVSNSDKFRLSFNNLIRFKDMLHWGTINFRKDFIISDEILEPFVDFLDWSNISKSMDITITEELIEKYRNKWDWVELSKNPRILENTEIIRKYIGELNAIAFLDQFRETPYVYHFTHLFNATQIINERKIKCRKNARGQFYNCAGTIADKNTKGHNYARFYYRPLTPNQLYNECLGIDTELFYESFKKNDFGTWQPCKKTRYAQSQLLGLPRNPMPICFKFDLKEIVFSMLDKCFYSDGCMQTERANLYKVSEDPARLNTSKLFSSIKDFNFGESELYKEFVQQEFLVFQELDFTNLNNLELICYNDEFANLLKKQLGDDPICEKITSNGMNVFHNANRKLNIKEDELSISISSEYKDEAYLCLRGAGIHDTQILNPENIKKENANELIAYPIIQFTKTEEPIEVYFVENAYESKEWLVYKN